MCDGDNSAFVATSLRKPFEFCLIIASFGSNGSGGRLHENRFEKWISFSNRDGLTFASTLVIAWTQPGPGGEAMVIRPRGHIVADLAENLDSRIPVDTRYFI